MESSVSYLHGDVMRENRSNQYGAPRAQKKIYHLAKHGHVRIDPYYWLCERYNPEVADYLNAENTFTEQSLKHTNLFQEKLFEEMRSRIKEDDSSVPFKKDNYWYYTRYEQGKEYPIYCRKSGSPGAKEEILMDVNKQASQHEYFQFSCFEVSPNHNMVAFAVDTVGRRKYTLCFKNLQTGEILADQIENVSNNFVWANDSRTVFYAHQHPQTLRSNAIYRHVLGESDDTCVYQEKDETFHVHLGKSLSQKYIFLVSLSTLQTEYRFLPADSPASAFKLFYPRKREHEYHIEHGGDRFFILTNENAKNFKVLQTPEKKIARRHWRQIVEHQEDVLVKKMTVFKDCLVLEEITQGLSNIRIINRATNESHRLDFEEPLYLTFLSTNPEYDTDTLRYGFESMKTPESIYDYHIPTRTKTLKKRQPVIGDFSPDNYVTERVWATAEDKTRIPISLIYRKEFQKHPSNPAVIYGYGSYGFSMEPYFSPHRLSLLDRGFVFAIAHVRGGAEMGRWWYENGRQMYKKNTFTDFIACSEFLINQGYTSSDHLYAMGGSAGGLLMGAIANMRPDLYNGIIADVPFVDVLTTMLDDSIPLTTNEYDEWGNPHIKEFYDYILSYSPYDNVTAQNYPNMLVLTSFHDSQVQYWEPAKWVAKLRDMKTDNNQLLLKTYMKAGHSGLSGRFQKIRDLALRYAFIFNLEGIIE